jgi:cellulose biosynthesis protein BcsQ
MNHDNPSDRELRGTIVTFYSYKGGVGRSMALANCASLLAKWGKRILIVDWDLEAPGIETYFTKWLGGAVATGGLVDIIDRWHEGRLDCSEVILRPTLGLRGEVHIIPAGRQDNNYTKRLQAIDWSALFEKRGFGAALEALRDEWKRNYDFVLVDSRTGITDIGGICTIHLPDAMVMLFTTSAQSILGTQLVMERVHAARSKLNADRSALITVPVPARDESDNEYELSEQWRERAGSTFSPHMTTWLPADVKPSIALNYLKLPYFAYWSFGERIAALEQEDSDNPKTMAFSYQPLARLMLENFDWSIARSAAQHSIEGAMAHAKAEEERRRALEIAAARETRVATMRDQLRRRIIASITETEEENYLAIRRWEHRGRQSRLLGVYSLVLGIVSGVVTVAATVDRDRVFEYFNPLYSALGLQLSLPSGVAIVVGIGSMFTLAGFYLYTRTRNRFNTSRYAAVVLSREEKELRERLHELLDELETTGESGGRIVAELEELRSLMSLIDRRARGLYMDGRTLHPGEFLEWSEISSGRRSLKRRPPWKD